MKLDFESLEKGINEELQKEANWLGAAGRAIGQGYKAVAPVVKDWWRFGGGKDAAKAVGGGAATAAGHVLKNPVPYTLAGGAAYFWDPVSQAYQVAKEGLGLAKDTVTNPLGTPPAVPGADGKPVPEQSTGDWLKGIKEKIQEVRKDGLAPWMANKAKDLYSQGESGLNSMLGEGAGRVLMPALGVGALTLGANYLLGGNKKRRYVGAHGQAPVVNVNIGGGGGQNPGMLNYSRSGVQSLSAPANLTSSYGMDNKYGMDMVKHAAGVTELLTKAVQQRAVNNAIDKFQEASKPSHQEISPEEEIEITSKYPEVAKLLKDEQNKAYLDRLLKE